VVIASGLIDDNADAAAALYGGAGLTERARLLASGWVALRLERA
jgi:ribosomal protein L11 methylase PrmA